MAMFFRCDRCRYEDEQRNQFMDLKIVPSSVGDDVEELRGWTKQLCKRCTAAVKDFLSPKVDHVG